MKKTTLDLFIKTEQAVIEKCGEDYHKEIKDKVEAYKKDAQPQKRRRHSNIF